MPQLRLLCNEHVEAAMRQRGVSLAEVEETVISGRRRPAKRGRLQAEKVFSFDAVWRDHRYAKKKVRVIF